MNGPHGVHAAGNAVPPLDGELAGILDDLDGIHPGIDLIRDGIRHLALDRHTLDATQTLIAAVAGGSDGTNVVNALGQLIARLATADSNPALRTLPLDQQKVAQLNGETTAFVLAHPDLAQFASDTSAAIDGI
ncbi:hypothetical protein [Streptomyces cylindrosporus]|uniref:Uncharacterized protein n=1 Tax=Streptomyces cylindrosporus TaxID=2927583 RepID=A0ABS9YPC0_9ACTN|nr:hypothetical protein [Streptomyces cylindrosporus]MCI3279118.1 hypothetical protein [Streptomyces cylindrosporus]